MNSEHLKLLKQGGEEWNQWREKNPEVKPALEGVDLRGVDLSEVDLGGAQLIDANLSGAQLRGSDLLLANLHGAQLRGANLINTTLIDANLSGANLLGAKLIDANLSGANLSAANLSEANLSRANLSSTKLHYTKLRGAKLSGVNLSRAKLHGTRLRGVDLSDTHLGGADLSEADLSRFDLSGFDLSGADLSGADLREANLRGVNLCGADLRETDLSRAQALGANFKASIFTGACLEDWNINSATKFDEAICEYVYLEANQQERRPREGLFKPGEFSALCQQAVDTVDLIFKDGIDWQAFFQSFQDLRSQYVDQCLSIQGIEKKRGGAFVVRLEVAEDADKTEIESSAKELYETKLALMEQRYRDVLQAKEEEIVAYREQSTNLMEIIKLQSVRPPMTEIPKYDLRGAQFAGGFAETVQGDQIGGTINNTAAETPSLAEAAAEIQNLLKQLEASNPSPTQAQQIASLDALIPPTRRERFVGALKLASAAAIEEVPYGTVLKTLVEGWQRPGE